MSTDDWEEANRQMNRGYSSVFPSRRTYIATLIASLAALLIAGAVELLQDIDSTTWSVVGVVLVLLVAAAALGGVFLFVFKRVRLPPPGEDGFPRDPPATP